MSVKQNSLTVNEIFYSIQGESFFSGYPCTFVRLTGCNLRCLYCDTKYAYDDGQDMSIRDIVTSVNNTKAAMVSITGGEPLLQKNTCILVDLLIDKGYNVIIETNGSMPINEINKRAVRVMDLKCPSSGMSGDMYFKNLELLNKRDNLKFVISDRPDYEWARKIIREYEIDKRLYISFQPVFGILKASVVADWLLDDHVHAALNIQLHKYLDKK